MFLDRIFGWLVWDFKVKYCVVLYLGLKLLFHRFWQVLKKEFFIVLFMVVLESKRIYSNNIKHWKKYERWVL